MIHKILLFNTTDENKADIIEQKTRELLAAVPGAQNVTFRRAIPEGDVRYRYLVTVDFETMAAHETYMVHEKHVEFSRVYFRPNISDLLIQFFEDKQ